MINDFDQISIDRRTLAVLKKMKKGPIVLSDKLSEFDIEGLVKLGLVRTINDIEAWFGSDENLKYELTYKGLLLLRYRLKDRFRFWFPIILSIFALLISAIALLHSLRWI